MTVSSTTNALSSIPIYDPNASTDATSSSSSSTSTSATDDAQNRFLKLLVAQLANQDPMNPMDNAQMTSQIAQINTVTGITQLNDTLKSMAAQATASQMMQATAMVGHSVLTEGSQVAFSADGKTAIGAMQLDSAATDVKVQVLTAGGQVVDTVQLGALAAGQQGFTLDASNYPSDQPLVFKVTATNNGTAVNTTSLMHDSVVAVGSDTTGVTLTLLRSGVTPYASVHSIL